MLSCVTDGELHVANLHLRPATDNSTINNSKQPTTTTKQPTNNAKQIVTTNNANQLTTINNSNQLSATNTNKQQTTMKNSKQVITNKSNKSLLTNKSKKTPTSNGQSQAVGKTVKQLSAATKCKQLLTPAAKKQCNSPNSNKNQQISSPGTADKANLNASSKQNSKANKSPQQSPGASKQQCLSLQQNSDRAKVPTQCLSRQVSNTNKQSPAVVINTCNTKQTSAPLADNRNTFSANPSAAVGVICGTAKLKPSCSLSALVSGLRPSPAADNNANQGPDAAAADNGNEGALELCVQLLGGEGDGAWQHAQLFRIQDTDTAANPFKIQLHFQ